ncbi:MAG: hypothetical protein M0D57_13940 [Sphingobacteriales bacterium JAD_PAG50586_3]|nr:MAG: hypothetical protein M0D57_13940 [Sphingobacteriales bacterium JAD_PAG50586_3]
MKPMHKNIIRVTLITAILYVLFTQRLSAQAVGINNDGSAPNANAMLDIKSPTKNGKGLLIPRITQKQRLEPAALGGLLDENGALRGGPAQGLIVYQTDGREGFYYNTSTDAMPNWLLVASVGSTNNNNNGTNGPSGSQGQQGVTGTTGVGSAWITGPAAPTGSQGNQGDFYLQQNNGLYYKKTSGTAWTQQGSLMGPAGATGPTGAMGITGATGPVGGIGATGATGPAGTMGVGAVAGNTPFWNGTTWVLNSSNLFNNGANIGIGTATPAEKLDVAGSIKFTGPLKPDGNAGAAGQVLASAGPSAPPVWASAFTKNNLYIDYSTGGAITNTTFANVPGLTRSLTLKAGDRVLLYATGGMAANGTVYTSADIGFCVNQQDLMNGGYTKASVDYAGSRFVPNANWTLMGHYDVPADGMYVFSVRTKQSSPSNGTATVGGDNTTVLQSTMMIQVLK